MRHFLWELQHWRRGTVIFNILPLESDTICVAHTQNKSVTEFSETIVWLMKQSPGLNLNASDNNHVESQMIGINNK